MIDYRIFINNGNEGFGTTGKTISIEEKPRTVSVDFLADAIHSQNDGDVLLRLYCDAKIKGGNINLARASELTNATPRRCFQETTDYTN